MLLGNRGLLNLLEEISFHVKSLMSIFIIHIKNMAYCVKCKRHTATNNLQHFVAKHGRVMLKGTCAVCGKTKTQFVKSGSGLFNKAVSNLPFELHLPGHNFTGPGTKLDRRLNTDGTPRDWSKPIIESTKQPITTTCVTLKIQTCEREMKIAIERCYEN